MKSIRTTRYDVQVRGEMQLHYPFGVRLDERLDLDQIKIALDWCRSLGPRASQFAPRHFFKVFAYPTQARWDLYDHFCFRLEDDATLFKLLWG